MPSTLVMNHVAVGRALQRVAHEIAERNEDSSQVVVLGVQRGGTVLARRLARQLEKIWGHPVPVGDLDVGMHRDDLDQKLAPSVHPTVLPCDINGRTIVLVDDVLYSGRTTRAAMDAVADFGRPEKIQLAVLIDRGHRDLPIKADFVGKNIPTARTERVNVTLSDPEAAGQDSVVLERSEPASAATPSS